jgi:hypothetical protein
LQVGPAGKSDVFCLEARTLTGATWPMMKPIEKHDADELETVSICTGLLFDVKLRGGAPRRYRAVRF